MRECNRQVFINCPFDAEYRDIFHAVCFTVLCCGFYPRSALEAINSAHVRLDKIFRLIGACDLSLHDISRTQPDPATGLPRFNMPFELGIAIAYGRLAKPRSHLLILDSEPHELDPGELTFEDLIHTMNRWTRFAHRAGVEN